MRAGQVKLTDTQRLMKYKNKTEQEGRDRQEQVTEQVIQKQGTGSVNTRHENRNNQAYKLNKSLWSQTVTIEGTRKWQRLKGDPFL